jgi:hypothetical protein
MTGLKVSLDPNEGWNAYHAQAAMAGQNLYPPRDSFMTNNYPPLSFFLVGALGRLFGDNIVAGRISSLLSFLAIAGAIGMAARRMGAGIAESAFGASFFAAMAIFATDYVGMDDPQLLAHALDMGGLLVLLGGIDPPLEGGSKNPAGIFRGGARTPVSPEGPLPEKFATQIFRPSLKGRVGTAASVGLAAGLFVVALFIKHNLIALPFAVALWLARYDRRHALAFTAAGLALAGLGLVACDLALHIDLLRYLQSARLYGFGNVTHGLSIWSVWGFVPAVAVLFLVLFEGVDRFVVLVGLYAALGLTFGAYFLGGAGVDQNAMFDADIALSLGVSLTLTKLAMRGSRNWEAALSTVFLANICFAAWQSADPAFASREYWLHPMREEAEAARDDIAFLRDRRGAALCETLALCYWAGKKAEADVFNLGQRYATHAMSDESFVASLNARHYATIELDPADSFPLTARVHRALSENYRIDHASDEGTFFVPR